MNQLSVINYIFIGSLWSILVFKSDLKWCIHLSRSLYLYLYIFCFLQICILNYLWFTSTDKYFMMRWCVTTFRYVTSRWSCFTTTLRYYYEGVVKVRHYVTTTFVRRRCFTTTLHYNYKGVVLLQHYVTTTKGLFYYNIMLLLRRECFITTLHIHNYYKRFVFSTTLRD